MALPVAGRVSDQFGRRKIFLICLAMVTLSSLLCATAENIFVLVAFRAVQAIGAAAFMPSAIGLLVDHYGGNRDRAVGMTTTTVPIGAMSGPVLGGVIVGYWSWRGVFLINVPIGIVLFLLAVRFIPPTAPKDASRADTRGIVLLAGALLPLMFGITSFGDGAAVASVQSLVPVVVSVAFIVAFVRHAKVAENPVIPLKFLAEGRFAALNGINFLFGGCVLGLGALLPLYSEERYRFTSVQAGSVLSARALGVLLVGGTMAMLVRRIGYRRPMLVGFSITATGLLILASAPRGLGTYAWLTVGAALMGVGTGISGPPTSNAMLHSAPSDAGSIAGLRGMFAQFGAITVISVTSALLARSRDGGVTLSHSYLVMAGVVVAAIIPLTFTISDHRGSW
jgi:MFS family permease